MHMNFSLNRIRVSENTLVKIEEGQQGRRIKRRKQYSVRAINKGVTDWRFLYLTYFQE